MKGSRVFDHERSLRIATLVLLPLLYVSVMLYQFSNVQKAPSEAIASEDTTTQAIAIATARLARANEVISVQRMRAVEEEKTHTPAPAPAPTSAVIHGRTTMMILGHYRDWDRCAETLQSLFDNAVEPDLIKVSIQDQIMEELGEKTCVEAYCERVSELRCRRSQILSTTIHASKAAGTTVARYYAEQAITNEDFCFGFDSHMIFAPRWDEKLVSQWEATENENAIITVYPKSVQFIEDRSKDNKMALMCLSRIEQNETDAMVQYNNVWWVDRTPTTKPKLMSQWAGGFNFGRCQAYKDVPSDPHTPILFYGEEYVRAARFWTWGYDLYAPSADIVYHWYEERRKIWEADWGARYLMLQRSKRRVRVMMGLPVSSDDYDHAEMEKYGLGKKRTFEQWKQFSRVDPLAPYQPKENWDQFNNCGDLTYVPYDK